MMEASDPWVAALRAATLALLDAGPGPARLELCGGVRLAMAAGNEAAVLAVILLQTPAGTLAADGLALTPSDEHLVLKTGEATWARLVTGGGIPVLQCTVAATGDAGDAELLIPTTTLLAGAATRLVSGTLG